MGRHEDARDDWEDDEADEWEGDGDDDSDGEQPTVPCPYCRRDVLEDSPWCPSCDRYLTAEDFQRADRPMWVVVTALICLAIALGWAFVSF